MVGHLFDAITVVSTARVEVLIHQSRKMLKTVDSHLTLTIFGLMMVVVGGGGEGYLPSELMLRLKLGVFLEDLKRLLHDLSFSLVGTGGELNVKLLAL